MHAHATMNRIFRLVWSDVLGAWVAVAENAKGKGKGGGRRKLLAPALAALGLSLAGVASTGAHAADTTQLPTGFTPTAVGKVHNPVTDAAGKVMTITQTTARAAIDWQTFNVAKDARVKFEQPGRESVTLNRVLDAQPSQILGQIQANGQVFLSNPNGVYFGQSASVDVGGLVATTHDLSNADFEKGNYVFKRGNAKGSVLNEGTLTAKEGGYIALLAPDVRNSGVIVAQVAGTVALAAGETITLTFEGDTKLTGVEVKPRDLQDLVARGLAVIGADGMVVLAPGAAEQLRGAVVNSGVIAANGLSMDGGRIMLRASDSITNSGAIAADAGVRGHGGEVTLIADLKNPDSVTVFSGSISARGGREGGDGGFVETSSALAPRIGGSVTTSAPYGRSGTWSIDPVDLTIGEGGTMNGATLSRNLENTDIVLNSSDAPGSDTQGSININQDVRWAGNHKLTLTASHNVNVNAEIWATGEGANVGIVIKPNTANGGNAASGSGEFVLGQKGKINLPKVAATSTTALVIGDQPYTVINSLGAEGSVTGTDLQGINGKLTGYFALGSDIDAGASKDSNGGQGFSPIGAADAPFTGKFDGLGHTIRDLTVRQLYVTGTGLFGVTAAGAGIRNLGLLNASVTGSSSVGALVGENNGSIRNSYASGQVFVDGWGMGGEVRAFGGLVGANLGSIDASNSSVEVVSQIANTEYVGGLVGSNGGTVTGSSATGALTFANARSVGGLVGYNSGSIIGSQAHGAIAVDAGEAFGGLIGTNDTNGTVINSFALGDVRGEVAVGGLVGINGGSVDESHAGGVVTGVRNVGGLAGDNAGAVRTSHASGAVSGQTQVGGLVGQSSGDIRDSHAGGNVSGELSIGGLVGYFRPALNGVVSDSHAEGDVTGGSSIGGLIGYSYGDVSHAYASGAVFSASGGNVGGLIGIARAGGVSDSHATGAVTGSRNVGGLVGESTANVSQSYAAGNVVGNESVGGLVGRAGHGTRGELVISTSHATGDVTGKSLTGGLVGSSEDGVVSQSYASGKVSGGEMTGGLMGGSLSRVSDSFASGDVSGNYSSYVGGLIGISVGTVTSSYATGAVTVGQPAPGKGDTAPEPGPGGKGDGPDFGADGATAGLVGLNLSAMGFGVVQDSYASGNVTGGKIAGGLVGVNSGKVGSSYASGAVTGATVIGGLVGKAEAGSEVADSFWNTDVTRQTGSELGRGAGHDIAWLRNPANFAAWTGGANPKWQQSGGNNHGLPCLMALGSCAVTPPPTPKPDPKPVISSISVRVSASVVGNVYGDPVGSFTYLLFQDGKQLDAGALNTLGVSVKTEGPLFDGAPTANSGAGTYHVRYQSGLSLTGGAATYNLVADGAIDYVISKRPLNLTAQRVYDGSGGFALATLVAHNLVNGDCAGGLAACGVSGSASVASKNAGTQALKLDGLSLGDTLAANYTLGEGSATILKRDVTVTATAPSHTYDRGTAADVKLSTTDGVALADKLAFSHKTAGFKDKNVGQNKLVTVAGISAAGDEAGNYNVINATAEARASITPRDLNVTALGENRVYDGERKAMVSFHDDKLVNDALTVSATSALFTDKNAGLHKQIDVAGIRLDGADAGNYRVVATSVTAHADITPRELHVTATGIDRKFDGGNAADVTLADNRVSGDLLSLRHGTASFIDAKVGEGKTVRVNGIAIDGADAGNYTLASTAASTMASVIAVAVEPTHLPQVAVSAPPSPSAEVAAALVAGIARITDGIPHGAATPVIQAVLLLPASGTAAASDSQVAVKVPAALLAGAFSVRLPVTLTHELTAAGDRAEMTDGHGATLPDWLRYVGHGTFDIAAAPVGALPLQVKLTVAGHSWTITLTERGGDADQAAP